VLVLFDGNGLIWRRVHPIDHARLLDQFHADNPNKPAPIPDFHLSRGMAVYLRPGVSKLLHTLRHEYGFSVGIYSSMVARNLSETIHQMMATPAFLLAFGKEHPFHVVWDARQCATESGDAYPSRKDVCRAWQPGMGTISSSSPSSSSAEDVMTPSPFASNSVILVDDSEHKIRSHRQNAVIVEPFDPFRASSEAQPSAEELIPKILQQLLILRAPTTSQQPEPQQQQQQGVATICTLCGFDDKNPRTNEPSVSANASPSATASSTPSAPFVAAAAALAPTPTSTHEEVKCTEQNEEDVEVADDPVVGTIWQHYRNKHLYRVVGVGMHTNDCAKLIVYQGLYTCTVNPTNIWCRPAFEWTEPVSISKNTPNQLVPRFSLA